MTYLEALKIIELSDPHAWRLRELCEDWSNIRRRDAYRHRVIEMAGGLPEPAEFPPAATMVRSAVNALAGFATSGFKVADKAERERRLGLCYGCEFYRADEGRCVKCGCVMNLKARIYSQHCPIQKW